jgi:hypothetical protein
VFTALLTHGHVSGVLFDDDQLRTDAKQPIRFPSWSPTADLSCSTSTP